MAPEAEPQLTEQASTPIDSESLTDQVWHDMNETVPRLIVALTVDQLLAKYRDGAIQTFVPMLVRREALELLRSVNPAEAKIKAPE